MDPGAPVFWVRRRSGEGPGGLRVPQACVATCVVARPGLRFENRALEGEREWVERMGVGAPGSLGSCSGRGSDPSTPFLHGQHGASEGVDGRPLAPEKQGSFEPFE